MAEQFPFELRFHCATQINSTYGIIIGGIYSQRNSLIVNLNDFIMTTGPTLRNNRFYDACTRISAANGTDYVIVAGRQTSEIMDGNSWKDGKY